MSLATWKKEFYPTGASTAQAKKKPVSHSLRKWQGAAPKNRKKHSVTLNQLRDAGLLESRSCALCLAHPFGCNPCPFYLHFNRICVDDWDAMLYENKTSPMIRALTALSKAYPNK